jgi:hypothetical protein
MHSPDGAMRALQAAISRGAPLYNSGDIAGCAALYLDVARSVRDGGSLTELSALEFSSLLDSPPADANARAWALRHAFDRFLGDVVFSPRLEAPLPRGFPGPGRAGRVEEKLYPAYRSAVAQQAGGGAFGALFRHISTNGVAMTSPVVTTTDSMAFCYESVAQGATAAPKNGVAVVDSPPLRVLSVGMRGGGGAGGEPPLALARRVLEARLAVGDLESTGYWRQLGYNSPMVTPSERFWELQVGVCERQ